MVISRITGRISPMFLNRGQVLGVLEGLGLLCLYFFTQVVFQLRAPCLDVVLDIWLICCIMSHLFQAKLNNKMPPYIGRAVSSFCRLLPFVFKYRTKIFFSTSLSFSSIVKLRHVTLAIFYIYNNFSSLSGL